MVHGYASIYRNTNSDWKLAKPYVYHNNAWVPAFPKIWDGSTWKASGGAGTHMVYFILSDGKYLTDSDGNYFLVRQG